MRAAIVDEAGTVVNIIVTEPNAVFSPGAGRTLVPSDTADLGDIWQDGVFTRPVPAGPDLDALKQARREEVNAIIDARTVLKGPDAVCATTAGLIQCDQNSRVNITGAVVLAGLRMQMAQPFELAWTRADNSQAVLDGPGMVAMGSAVAAHVAAVHMAGRTFKAAIDAATDADALASIAIYAGWP